MSSSEQSTEPQLNMTLMTENGTRHKVWVQIAISLRLILNPTISVWSFNMERWDGSLSPEIWKQKDVLADFVVVAV